ncbi:response regulator transcription factor [Zoogloea sp.]|uniref:response regulator transcription factor n=1 Tax=Zoogloea sp. TaxID=49181 RepID=UPI00260CFE1D|nr:response regulator transcription factor [Zoogloea sp.]
MTVRILIADDHKLVRAGLAMLIEEIPGYEVIAQADDGVSALESAIGLKPDVILVDINMPRMSGLECLAKLREQVPEIHVLMLSMYANEEHVIRSLNLGARGYLLKDATPSELELAIRTVADGNLWLSAAVSTQVLKRYGTRGQPAGEKDDVLTARQQQILQRLAEGASIKEIAFELSVSIKTVETHKAQIMERLGLHDIPALVRYAIRNGIVAL